MAAPRQTKPTAVHPFALLQISALYQGATRQRTLDVYVDGEMVRTWTSSGETDDFETIDLTGNDGQLLVPYTEGQVLELSGSRVPSEWISILEVSGVRLYCVEKKWVKVLSIGAGPPVCTGVRGSYNVFGRRAYIHFRFVSGVACFSGGSMIVLVTLVVTVDLSHHSCGMFGSAHTLINSTTVVRLWAFKLGTECKTFSRLCYCIIIHTCLLFHCSKPVVAQPTAASITTNDGDDLDEAFVCLYTSSPVYSIPFACSF